MWLVVGKYCCIPAYTVDGSIGVLVPHVSKEDVDFISTLEQYIRGILIRTSANRDNKEMHCTQGAISGEYATYSIN